MDRTHASIAIRMSSATIPISSCRWALHHKEATGATNPTVVLLNVTNTAVGNYFVRVTNFFGLVNSSNAFLTVTQQAPPVGFGGTLRFNLGSGEPRLQFDGVPGQTYLIEASTNLVDWTVIGTASDVGDGTFEFTDPEWMEYDRCYYRIIVP